MQRVPPPASLFLSSLTIFPEEFVPAPCRYPAASCPAHLRTPLHFCWQTGTHHILSGGSHCFHSQALGLFVFVKTNTPSKTQLLHNVLTYRIGITPHAPKLFLRSRKHFQHSYCPWAHPRTLQPLPTSSGSPMARLPVTTWMSSREVR